jgi:16S rRNA (guanine527-N7)-methyltransferase
MEVTGEVEALRPALRAIVTRLALEVTDAQIDALLAYLSLLQRWNAIYNLTAVREPARMLTQHLADCLAIIDPLRRVLGGGAARVLDVGSGAGLPGVIVAILNPTVLVTCVDTVGKKAAFVQQVATELRLHNLRAAHGRVEQLKTGPFDVVVSRAFASLTDFVRLTGTLLAPRGMWMAMKGKVPLDELRQLPASIDVFHVEQLAVPDLDAERCIVWMRPKE